VQLARANLLRQHNKRLTAVPRIQWAIIRAMPIMPLRLTTERTSEKLQVINKSILKFPATKRRLPMRA
jgi:hypothetical protein